MRRLLAVCSVAILGLFILPTAAHADTTDWKITRYQVTADAASNGEIDVLINFNFDFANEEAHGPYVTLPTLQEIDGDSEHYRQYPITNIKASSSTGAPAFVDTERDGRALAIKIGDEDIEVKGKQSYELSYTIAGIVNPGVGAAAQDEIFWNIIGPQWEVPLHDVTIDLNGPAAAGKSSCFVGSAGSTAACDDTSVSGNGATFSQSLIEPGRGLTVVADWPQGTFVGAEPILVPRRSIGNTFSLNPLTGTLAGAIALLGSLALGWRVRRGRDQQYVGLTPGLAPVADGVGAVGVRDRNAPVAVQFSPPVGLRPGELGTLIDEVAHPHDVTATIVDLAVRGHLRIEETTDETVKKADRKWRLIKLNQPTDLMSYEKTIFDGLFANGDDPDLDDLGPAFATVSTKTKSQLYESVTDRGWFTGNPQNVRAKWYGLGILLVLAGVGATIALAATIGWGLVGLGVVLLGIVTIIAAHAMPARTAEGSAALAQTLGFKTYLETAEGDQLRFEEGDDIFSRYLPYAIAFGVADHWAKVFADLAAQGYLVPEPAWYVGPHHAAFFASSAAFSDTLGAFSSAATASMTAATSGSSGGSGFSGGSVGGGVGGGGGGGW